MTNMKFTVSSFEMMELGPMVAIELYSHSLRDPESIAKTISKTSSLAGQLKHSFLEKFLDMHRSFSSITVTMFVWMLANM